MQAVCRDMALECEVKHMHCITAVVSGVVYSPSYKLLSVWLRQDSGGDTDTTRSACQKGLPPFQVGISTVLSVRTFRLIDTIKCSRTNIL